MIDLLMEEIVKLSIEELPILLALVKDLIDARKAGQSQEEAVAAARLAARTAVDALEAAAVK